MKNKEANGWLRKREVEDDLQTRPEVRLEVVHAQPSRRVRRSDARAFSSLRGRDLGWTGPTAASQPGGWLRPPDTSGGARLRTLPLIYNADMAKYHLRGPIFDQRCDFSDLQTRPEVRGSFRAPRLMSDLQPSNAT